MEPSGQPAALGRAGGDDGPGQGAGGPIHHRRRVRRGARSRRPAREPAMVSPAEGPGPGDHGCRCRHVGGVRPLANRRLAPGEARWKQGDGIPLQSASSTGALEGAGEGVATYIGYALEGTAPLRWLEARDFLGDREDGTPLARAEAQRVARTQRASFYIDGSILDGPESVTVVLRLYDVEGDSVIRRAGASSRSSEAFPPPVGLEGGG